MRWQAALDAALDALVADSALEAVVDGAIYMAGERGFEVPSVEWTLVDVTPAELFEPFTVQFDGFARTMDDVLTIQDRLYAVLHSEVWRTLGGVKMRTQFSAVRQIEGAEDGVLGLSIDFEFEPFKERFATVLGSES